MAPPRRCPSTSPTGRRCRCLGGAACRHPREQRRQRRDRGVHGVGELRRLRPRGLAAVLRRQPVRGHALHEGGAAVDDRAGWGRVVTIVSDAARNGDAKLSPYAAAKAGAAGFCRSIAREVGRHAITVNCVSLGNIATPATAAATAGDARGARAREAFLRPYVIRRRGRPDDVAGLVTYLASPLAEWITGQTYAVNGGYTFSL